MTSQAAFSIHNSTQNKQQNRIKKLPPLLVNQLAAGEVVTRPASVVKELIENAIDAGASEITIKITQGGMGLIEVCDNGCGIHPDDMVMAVTRFATSKIADVAHLQGISTLGFRGEALAATAAVSRLTVKSSCDDSGIGRELTVAGILEDTPSLIPIVHPQGTTVTVRDLYFNVPARRGNLKSISTEFNHIETVVRELALVASDITIGLWHNDKRRFNFEAIYPEAKSDDYSIDAINKNITEVSKAIISRLQMILPSINAKVGNAFETLIQPITVDLSGLTTQTNCKQTCQISGLLLPQSNLSSSTSLNLKLVYINGRLVKDKRIAQCLRESVASFQKNNDPLVIKELGYVLFFQLPKTWLNLNVHPSKRCIKIQNLENITAHLKIRVRDGLLAWLKKQPDEQISKYFINNQANNQHIDNSSANSLLDSRQVNDSIGIDYKYTVNSETSDKPFGINAVKFVAKNAQQYSLSYDAHNERVNNNRQLSHTLESDFKVSDSIKREELRVLTCLSILDLELEADKAKGLLNRAILSELTNVLTNHNQALVLVQLNSAQIKKRADKKIKKQTDEKLLLISDSALLRFLHSYHQSLASDNNELACIDSIDLMYEKYSNLSSKDKLNHLNSMIVICLSGKVFDNITNELQDIAICSMSYQELMIAMLKQT